MTKFSQLTSSQQTAAALEAVRRAIAGNRMRENDAEALQHAASILELFIVPELDGLKTELVGPRDFFDTLAMKPSKTLKGGADDSKHSLE